MKSEFTNYSLDFCLDNLSLDIMLSNVQQQVKNPDDIRTDFLSIIQDKWEDIESNCEDIDVLSELRYKIIDFFGEVISTINKEFNLCMDYEADSMSAMDVAGELYAFFVIDRISIIESFLKNYINANKLIIAQSLGINEKGKDVSSIACRRREVDKSSIPMIAHIGKVIRFIIDNDLEVEELLNYGEVENAEIIEDMLLDNTINNNFTYNYINNIMGRYDGLVGTRIRNNIRNSLYR